MAQNPDVLAVKWVFSMERKIFNNFFGSSSYFLFDKGLKKALIYGLFNIQ